MHALQIEHKTHAIKQTHDAPGLLSLHGKPREYPKASKSAKHERKPAKTKEARVNSANFVSPLDATDETEGRE